MKGSVKFFNNEKGFGFIKSLEDGKEYFVHITSLPEGMTLRENEVVTFDVEEGRKGLQAANVQYADEGADMSSEDDMAMAA